MTARLIDPSEVARRYRQDLRQQLASLAKPLRLVGFLAPEQHDAAAPASPSALSPSPSATYANYTKIGCLDVGIQFDLRQVSKFDLEVAIDQANADPNVHGIIVYYPYFGTEHDSYIKDLVDHRKDIEGLNTYWARKLYHNQRYVDPTRTQKALLPCTPLAIVKLIEESGIPRLPGRDPLLGRTVVIFNRSEVVGRPLASMLANDAAEVYSFDIDGPLLFKKEHVVPTDATRAEALARADIVITGVPSRSFPLVEAREIRQGAICINFSTMRNFTADVAEKAAVFIPRVGPMTVAMALRNTLRLYQNYQTP